MRSLKPDKDIHIQKIKIFCGHHKIPTLDDCYAALLYMKSHAETLGIRDDQLMVGGESAGGGLCAAVCIRARDEESVNIAFQMPLYPMLDDRDTKTSRDNHGKVWNTRKNHFAWRILWEMENRFMQKRWTISGI